MPSNGKDSDTLLDFDVKDLKLPKMPKGGGSLLEQWRCLPDWSTCLISICMCTAWLILART